MAVVSLVQIQDLCNRGQVKGGRRVEGTIEISESLTKI